MKKSEAYQEMLSGAKMRHEYYLPEEFVFINENGQFETEDSCILGGVNDEFWAVYQKWEDGWDYYNPKDRAFYVEQTEISHVNDPYVYQFKNFHPLDYGFNPPTKQQVLDSKRIIPVGTKSEPNRNDKCTCLSGKKYKKCCGKN